jgi:predicted DNA-binding protein
LWSQDKRAPKPGPFDEQAEKSDMSRKKISTTIYVTPEQNDRLKLLHERTKVPVAVYIREGIDLVLKHYAHLLPGQLALDVVPANTGTARVREEDEESAPIVPRPSELPLESVAASGKK